MIQDRIVTLEAAAWISNELSYRITMRLTIKKDQRIHQSFRHQGFPTKRRWLQWTSLEEAMSPLQILHNFQSKM